MVIMKTKKPKKIAMHPKKLAKLMTQQTNDEEYENADDGVIGSEESTAPASKIPKNILIIAQEVKIVQALACNDLNRRNRQLRKLRKWLQLRTRSSFEFAEEDFMRIWKGLYYNMWMSDKPLVQEELAEQLGQLLECFDGNVTTSVNFFGAFLRTMCTQWFGIDQWRIDKFMMLARRMLRYMFRVLKGAEWSPKELKRFGEHMLKTVLSDETSATGLTMHFLDIFCEELAKVSGGALSAEAVGTLVRPFVTFLATHNDFKLISHCRTRIFYHLLYQSALGREYSEKYNAWKDMGFPTANIDDLEKLETASVGDEDEEEEAAATTKHLDPRAGNVDVFMPELPLDGKYVIEELEAYIYKRESTTKCRKMLKKLLEVFQTYQRGEFPLGIKTMPRFESKSEKPLIREKISQLENLENELYGTGRKLKQLNKRKRRKLLKSLNFDDVDEATFDQTIEKAIPKQYLKERKKRVMAMMSGWVEEEIDVAAEKLQEQGDDEQEAVVEKKLKKKNKRKPENEEKKIVAPKKNKQKLLEEQQEKSEAEPTPKKQKKLEKKQITVEAVEKPVETPKKSAAAAAALAVVATTTTTNKNEWDEVLGDGEVEYFIPSRKLQLKKANSDLVRNPLAKKSAALSTPTNQAKPSSVSAANTPKTPASVKRVKIALKHNTAQAPSEYIKQIKSSPNVPYDADKKPGKGLLKPNSMPSPINPFYKKKIGLKLSNDTL